MTKFVTAFLISLSLTPAARAFINIESVRLGATDDFVGKSKLTLSGNGGNTNKSAAAFSSVNIRRWRDSEFLGLLDYNHETTNSTRNVNNGRLHLRYSTATDQARSSEYFVQGEFDEFQNLNSRRLAGANLRLRALANERRTVHLGLGAFYEDEDYRAVDDRYTVRGNLYVAYTEALSDILNASTTVYYQPSLTRGNDYRIRLQSALSVRMTDRLAVVLEFELKHESNLPDPALEKTDTRYLSGFSVTY